MNYLAKVLESSSKTLLSADSFFLHSLLYKHFVRINVFHKHSLFSVVDQIRGKKVKAKGRTRNAPRHPRPKHRGCKVQDGNYVSENKILVLQFGRSLRFHPGLNVGFGKNGTLFALQAGRVVVTCDPINPNWDHTWIQRIYAGQEDQTIYKKHFNVIPFEQHNRFRKIDEI